MALPPRIMKVNFAFFANLSSRKPLTFKKIQVFISTLAFMVYLVAGISAVPSDSNPRHFYVKIAGPSGTAYEGGLFDCELFLPDEYPMVPPKVLFKSKIFHPNIDKLGKHSKRKQ